MTPAHISIRAKSLIRGVNSDIYFSFCYIYRKINALFYYMQTSVILSRGEILFSAYPDFIIASPYIANHRRLRGMS